jgi:2-methylisocitrate lyase-like PEP mutase family enzyme
MKFVRKLFRELLDGKEGIIAPCAYDALSARMIEASGFKMAGTTGYGMHGSILGCPDNGMLAFNEMVEACGKMADAVNIPLLADAEGGYGNAINVIRSVRDFEKAGMAGIFIEDQVLPPNCPFIHEPRIITEAEMVGKIEAAVMARCDKNFAIIARTDARFDEAIERAKVYKAAGADMIKIFPKTRKELEQLPSKVDAPLHFGVIPGQETTKGLTAKDLFDMGYKIVTYPMTVLFSSVLASMKALAALKKYETEENPEAQMMEFKDYVKLVNGDIYRSWEEKYLRGEQH